MTKSPLLYQVRHGKILQQVTADELTQCEPLHITQPNSPNRVGLLFIHGFMSTPASVRPLVDALMNDVYQIMCPLLPGCGTVPEDACTVGRSQWQEQIENAYLVLQQTCQHVIVIGQSLGGALALNLAHTHRHIHHLLLLAPALHLPFALKHVTTIKRLLEKAGIHFLHNRGGDINKEAEYEITYRKTPLSAFVQLRGAMDEARSNLSHIRTPTTLFAGAQDHVLKPKHMPYLLNQLGCEKKELIWLPNSYHLLSKDNDNTIIINHIKSLIKKITTN